MMNERIKELAEQAGFGPKWTISANPGEIANINAVLLKEFAELIVKECAQVAVGYVQEENCKLLEDRTISTWDLKCKIEEHFGVE